MDAVNAEPRALDPVAGSAGFQRWTPVMALVWLVFLVQPLVQAIRLGTTRGEIGAALLAAFAGVYVIAGLRMRVVMRADDAARREARRVLAWCLIAMIGLAALAGWAIGDLAVNCLPYLAVIGPFLFGVPGLAWVLAIGGLAWGVLAESGQAGDQILGFVTGTLSAGFGVWALVLVMERQRERLLASELEATRAVETERGRFARDLHDIVGHSLSVVTMKASLARRLMDVDLDRARQELAELEELARDALTEVRRAVGGYRDVSLAGELAMARQVLSAAEIEADLPGAVDDVDPRLRELFAWTVREGVTNTVRHSRASRCVIALSRRSVSIRDDGVGARDTDVVGGNGLLGLRERASTLGAVVTTRRLDPGFELLVTWSENR